MEKKRNLTARELNEIRVEEDMLQGNINRMCVCDNSEELIKMRDVARLRLVNIFEICSNKFIDGKRL